MAASPAVPPHLEFAPPPAGGLGRALVLALLIHAALMAALTWGIGWNRTQTVTMQAELWASVPVQAAPAETLAPPPPPPAPEPLPEKPEAAPPAAEDAEIVLERRRKETLEKKRLEAERREAERQRNEERRKEEERKKAAEKRAAEKKAAEKKAEDERKRRELAEQKDRREREHADVARREAEHQENVRRLQGLAGATGGASSSGTARQSAGPSDSYGGRIVARVKPNIVFTDNVSGNPQTEVEVRAAPDGTIVGARIVKASGVKAWDDAVLKALEKTQTLPRDVDGRVPPSLMLVFRPRD